VGGARCFVTGYRSRESRIRSHTLHAKSSPPDLLTTRDLAELVGLPLNELTWWVYGLRPSKRYTRFNVQKRSGGVREIHAPIKPIKDVQRRLLVALAPAYRPTLNIHGFVAGRSPVSNARPHQRQTSVLRADILDFFPSIHFGRVRGLFRAFPFDYPDDVAQLLAHICCHRGALPQGAPTSPLVSNLICRGLDRDLAQLAKEERCYFTRYADDLSFSTRRRQFPVALADMDESGVTVAGKRLHDLVEHHGFVLNGSKTRLVHYAQRQRVTGLIATTS
jgi:RNA-directed DNA polymerase